MYNGRFTEKVMDEFSDLVTKSIQQFITEKVNERLTNALTVENEKAEELLVSLQAQQGSHSQ